MSSRQIDKKIEEIRANGGEIYSISRLNAYNQCPYQFYLTYIKGIRGEDNVYSALGGATHDALEECVNTGKDNSIVKAAIKKELENLEVLGLDFPLDRNGNPTIRNNWIANMERFAEEWKTPRGKLSTEELVLYQLDDNNWMQGYIDLIQQRKDGSISIYDYKTSTKYQGKHLLEAGRQLILYALAKQKEGHDIHSISWVFLKYCEVSWTLKNGKTKTKVCEWRNLVKDMKNQFEKDLSDMGLDEIDCEVVLHEALESNQIPADLKDKYKVKLFVQDYPFTDENTEECLSYINRVITSINEAGDKEENYPSCDISKESYFCSSLCGHKSRCKHWESYCDQFINEEDEDDLF